MFHMQVTFGQLGGINMDTYGLYLYILCKTVVRRMDLSTYQVTTIAGAASVTGRVDGICIHMLLSISEHVFQLSSAFLHACHILYRTRLRILAYSVCIYVLLFLLNC